MEKGRVGGRGEWRKGGREAEGNGEREGGRLIEGNREWEGGRGWGVKRTDYYNNYIHGSVVGVA